jgi:hypothetical protein
MSEKSRDQIFKVCLQCLQKKPVPFERAEEYRKAHAGEAFKFICKDCATRDQSDARLTGGTVDDPLDPE